MGSIKEVSVPPIPLGYQTGPPSVTSPVYRVCLLLKTFGEGVGAKCVLVVEKVLVGGGTTPLNPTAGRRGAGAALDDGQTPARCHPQGAEDISAHAGKNKKGEGKGYRKVWDRCLARPRTPKTSQWRRTMHEDMQENVSDHCFHRGRASHRSTSFGGVT